MIWHHGGNELIQFIEKINTFYPTIMFTCTTDVKDILENNKYQLIYMSRKRIVISSYILCRATNTIALIQFLIVKPYDSTIYARATPFMKTVVVS